MIWAIVIGFFIGVVAKFLMPGRDPGGFIVTALIGIVGSAVAHWLGASMGYYHDAEPAGFVASVLGAMLLLFGYRALIGRTA